MRLFLILSIFVVYSFSLTLSESKHLLNRTSFGYTPDTLKKFMKLSKEQSVEYLLTQASSKGIIAPPANIIKNSQALKGLSKEQRKKARKAQNKKMQEIQNWWLKMMFEPKYAFREKMTLFWHNHFVSEYKVVKNPYLMYKQNRLYREEALGSFARLTYKSSKDLAMLIYLDNNSNKKKSPNENYARELLELFTLGEGYYSENDIKEAARAFTGWRARKKDFSFKKLKKQQDNGIKNFFGRRGNFDGENIISIVLEQDRVAVFIVEKLYKEFISYNLDKRLVTSIANDFRNSNYDIKVAMRKLLLSDEFWNSKSEMIKSPVEFIVGLVNHFEYKPSKKKELKRINKTLKKLGQTLFNPPGVQGWKGGKSWIDVSSLIDRQNFIKALMKKHKKIVAKKSINDFDTFSNFFFSSRLNEDERFKGNLKNYISYLSKVEYQIK